METLRIKKGPVILPLILLAVVLAMYTLSHFQSVSAADCLKLGQQYLNDLNYEGAVMEFTNAIELNPNSADARIGLAQAYIGTENYEFAKQILEPMVYSEQPAEDAAAIMVELLADTNALPQAVELTQALIKATDQDKYYDLLNRLLDSLYGRPRSFAVGTDQALLLRDGQVFSRGSNTLGQLGVNVASRSSADRLASAQFGGSPAKVACVGRTSLVIDQDGGLWAAGENRWGQLGEGFAITAPESGWRQLTCPWPVIDAAGTNGRLLLLLGDGSLWTAGAGTGQSFQRLTQFPVVMEIAASQSRAAVLTSEGVLYTSNSRTPDRWELVSRDVFSFSLSDDCLCWIDGENEVYSDQYSFQIPDECRQTGGMVVYAARVGQLALCVTQDHQLWMLSSDGSTAKVGGAGAVAAMYPQGRQLVLEYEDGTVQCWTEDMDMPQDPA